MSLEDRIADLQQQAGLLLDLPQAIADEATDQIIRIGNANENIINTQDRVLFIDPVGGDDTAVGSTLEPLQTIQAAINLVPRGGSVDCRLKGDYDMSIHGAVDCAGRFVHITSETSVKHSLIFSEFIDNTFSPSRRNLRGLLLGEGSTLSLRGLRLVWPADVHSSSGFSTVNGAMVQAVGIGDVLIVSCDIDIPATVAFRLFNANDMVRLYWFANVILPGSQPLAGNIHAAHTSTAGFDPLNSRLVQTNLAQI